MRATFGLKRRENAQTLVFFLLAWGMIMLLCGLAIDSGLLYLAKAKLSRAVDGAALAAVGNFNRDPDPATNRDDVAKIMRNFASANFTDLSLVGASGGPPGGTPTTTTLPNGTQSTSYTYNFNDGTQDPNGQFKRFVQVTLNTGSNGAITSATCNARCPVQTYFIGYATYAINGQQNGKIGGYSGYKDGEFDLKVSSSAVASRHPRLIVVVIDRSASMLAQGGGAIGLAPAVVQFLDFFDTSSDSIGIVSFGSSARLEMPLTTNFIIAATNNLSDTYNSTDNVFTPGVDPEADSLLANYDPNYNTTGVRRFKFGGDTAADDGIRLGIEQLMANPGFTDPDVVKYMVVFTDGRWNASRTLVAAPGYTNRIDVPNFGETNFASNDYADNFTTNGQQYFLTTIAGVITTNYGPWVAVSGGPSQPMSANSNILPVPTLSPLPDLPNALTNTTDQGGYGFIAQFHMHDAWLSADGNIEPLGSARTLEGGLGNIQGTTVSSSRLITNNAWVGTTNSGVNTINLYTHQFDVWLQPGSVAYLYHKTAGVLAPTNSGGVGYAYVSDYTNPTKHIFVHVNAGDRLDLVVPGYIVDGVIYDGLDLDAPDDGTLQYARYRSDNYQQPGMWPDDGGGVDPIDGNFYTASLRRNLLFRNYANLLTGFYAFRADEPNGPGFEPLITEQNPPGAPRPRYGLGAYYPSAGFYWPFGGEQTNAQGYVTNAVGVDTDPTYGLEDPTSGGGSNSRHIAWSINMLSSNAAPEWYGELFYKGSGATNNVSTSTAASTIMQSADWQNGLPAFASAFAGVMTPEATHNTTIVGRPSVWRPLTFNGSNNLVSSGLGGVSESDGVNLTGGYVTDGNGHYYRNTMAWSGRPTHYFNFAQGTWIPIGDNHTTNAQFLQLGNWKASEYAWHARDLGVTIYTVGYGSAVTAEQCVFLATLANATNSISPGSPLVTNPSSFNPNQPIGQQFYATTPIDISNDFFQVGQAINAALTQ